ncbi:hypothetical protein DIPPA_34781 [Diplonema papillatum]|nr:hypothetical protein DIPPA_34781 [Diplonema papillatum]
MWRTVTRLLSGTPDNWVEAFECMCCDREFTVYRRKHHCRACGKAVCGRCWDAQRNFRCVFCLLSEDVQLWGPCETASLERGDISVGMAVGPRGVTRAVIKATRLPLVLPLGSWVLTCNGALVHTAQEFDKYISEEPSPVIPVVQLRKRLRSQYVVEVYAKPSVTLTLTLDSDTHNGEPKWRCSEGGVMVSDDQRWVLEGKLRSGRSPGLLPEDAAQWEHCANGRWKRCGVRFVSADAAVRKDAKVAVLTAVEPKRLWHGATVNNVNHTMVTVRFDGAVRPEETIDASSGRVVPEVRLDLPAGDPPAADGERPAKKKEKKAKKDKKDKKAKKSGKPPVPPAPPPAAPALLRSGSTRLQPAQNGGGGDGCRVKRASSLVGDAGAQPAPAASVFDSSSSGSDSSGPGLRHVTMTRARPQTRPLLIRWYPACQDVARRPI